MFSFEQLLQAYFVPLLADATIKVTVLMAMTALIAALARRASAATRHSIWMLGLLTALCLPLLCQALPHLSLTLPERFASVVATVQLEPRHFTASPMSSTKDKRETPTAANDTPLSQRREERAETTVSSTVSSRSFLPATLLLIWLGGMGFVLAQCLTGSIGLRRLVRVSTVVSTDSPLSHAFDAAEEAMPGTRRAMQLRVTLTPDVVRTPLTWGWRHPVVLLPSDADEWAMERLHAVLLHEIAHVGRHDWLFQRLAQLTCALFWFHPLVWIAARAARLESENASDDLVLAAGIAAPEYARHLLDTARMVRRAPLSRNQGAIAMISPRPSELETRLRAILATHRSRRPLSKKRTRIALAAALLLALPVAALRPVIRAQESIVRKIEGIDQYISKDLVRAVLHGNRIVEYDLAARRNAPAQVVPGYQAELPNGYKVKIIGLVRLKAKNGYWQYADPQTWQTPDGSKLTVPPVPDPMIQSGLSPALTRGIAPVLIVTQLESAGNGTIFLEPRGVAQDQEWSWVQPYNLDFPYGKNQIPSFNTYTDALFPKDSTSFALRASAATGPWKTRVVKPVSFTPATVKTFQSRAHYTLPKETFSVFVKLDDKPSYEYADNQGKWHAVYFLPEGQRLGAEDRRIVAVDKSGKALSIAMGIGSGGLRQFGVPIGSLAFTPSQAPNAATTPGIRLAQIKELRLETRPFQRVEFQNIQIPPQPVK